MMNKYRSPEKYDSWGYFHWLGALGLHETAEIAFCIFV